MAKIVIPEPIYHILIPKNSDLIKVVTAPKELRRAIKAGLKRKEFPYVKRQGGRHEFIGD